MACKYFAVKVGNKFNIGVGKRAIGEIWFKSEGESELPLTFEESEKIANKIVKYLEDNYPLTEEDAELYGDSDESIRKFNLIEKYMKDPESLSTSEKIEIMAIAVCSE